MRKLTLSAVVAAICAMSGLVSPVHADDGAVTLGFSDYTPQTGTHEDADPFKGALTVTVTNNMSEAWGDFHFQLIDVGWDISNVDFVVDGVYEPTSSQAPLTWAVDNVAYGSTLDLYYYSDPVLPGETATFTVYTDNTTDQLPFFGWSMYPTPVPEPTMLLLFALGAVMWPLRRRA